MSFTKQPNGTCEIGVTLIESVNFKSQCDVISKANSIHKEKDLYPAIVAYIKCIVLHITELDHTSKLNYYSTYRFL